MESTNSGNSFIYLLHRPPLNASYVLKIGVVFKNMFDKQRLKEMRDEQIKKSKSSPKYLAFDGKTWKKSPSVWSFRDHLCEACGKTFTHGHSLKEQQKYSCPKFETDWKRKTKAACARCGKMVSKKSVYYHAKHVYLLNQVAVVNPWLWK